MTHEHVDVNDPVFEPMQKAMLERIAKRRELVEMDIRYGISDLREKCF